MVRIRLQEDKSYIMDPLRGEVMRQPLSDENRGGGRGSLPLRRAGFARGAPRPLLAAAGYLCCVLPALVGAARSLLPQRMRCGNRGCGAKAPQSPLLERSPSTHALKGVPKPSRGVHQPDQLLPRQVCPHRVGHDQRRIVRRVGGCHLGGAAEHGV